MLPNEILLEIIKRVDFSSENLNSLMLVNRHFHQLIVTRGKKLLNDIAEVQCPYALTAYRYPRSPFAVDNEFLSMGALRELVESSHRISTLMSKMEDIMDRTPRNRFRGPPKGNWRETFLVGLHTFNRLSKIAQDHKPEQVGRTHRGLSSLCRTYVDSLPAATCLAMRYMTLETAKYLKADTCYLSPIRLVEDLWPVPVTHFPDKVIRIALEQDALSVIIGCVNARSATDLVLEDWPGYCLMVQHADRIRTLFRKVHDGELIETPLKPRFDRLVTRRIREDILGQWDRFVEDNPQVVANLRAADARDNEGVRTLIHSFLDDFDQ